MFTDFADPETGPPWRAEPLPTPGEALLLWSLRRMVVMIDAGDARCHWVHVALQQRYGDDGQGVEHLLRCWLVGLQRTATRCLVVGEPACALLLPDEQMLLRALRHAGDAGADSNATGQVLATLTGNDQAAALTPLVAELRRLAQL